MGIGLYPTVGVCNVHASFSDGLADSFQKLLHSAHLLFLYCGVFYISLSTAFCPDQTTNPGDASARKRCWYLTEKL